MVGFCLRFALLPRLFSSRYIGRKSKFASPDYGPFRLPVPALFIADVSHTANSNTQLMLLYETNERMNEKYKCRNI